MCKNMAGGRRKKLQGGEFRGPTHGWLVTSDRLPATTCNLTDCMPLLATLFFFAIFGFFFTFIFGVMRMGLGFWENGCIVLPFFEACPTLERMKSSIPHGAWRFHFFPNFSC
jgi:hypothetical protein